MIFEPEPFQTRHIGPSGEDAAAMLTAIGAASMDALIDEAIPSRIRLKAPFDFTGNVKLQDADLTALERLAAPLRPPVMLSGMRVSPP